MWAMIKIKEIDDMKFTDMDKSVLDIGSWEVWEKSVKKVAIYDDDQLLCYAGGMETEHGLYVWATITRAFQERYALAVRYGFRVLNAYYRMGYKNMWCLIPTKEKKARRLARMIGFEFTGHVVSTYYGTCCQYRRA